MPRCLPHLEAAMEHSAYAVTVAEMLTWVLEGTHYHLWPGEESAIVTEITPDGERLNFWLAGGNAEELERMVPWVESWGRSRGVRGFYLFGRRGWARSFMREHGYEPRHVVMVKEYVG